MIDRTIYSATVLANLLPLAKNLREKLDEEEEKEDEEKEEEEEEEEDEEDEEEEEEEEEDDDDDEKDEMDFPLIHESFDERLNDVLERKIVPRTIHRETRPDR
uniref:Uncharacterized protein n=1 Tax=Vespula germanica TaxID=30212 RepID=A0A834NDX1_VESGE|nr:hypothetical protein HZH68_006672 [Vespula germanica]